MSTPPVDIRGIYPQLFDGGAGRCVFANLATETTTTTELVRLGAEIAESDWLAI